MIRFVSIRIPARIIVFIAPLIISSLLYSFSYVAASDVATSRSTSPLFPMEPDAIVVHLLFLLLFSLSHHYHRPLHNCIRVCPAELLLPYLLSYFTSCCLLLFSLILVVCCCHHHFVHSFCTLLSCY